MLRYVGAILDPTYVERLIVFYLYMQLIKMKYIFSDFEALFIYLNVMAFCEPLNAKDFFYSNHLYDVNIF